MSDLALEIKNLDTAHKDFDLKSININLEKGCIMGLIGENGAGKTTLIKSIMNMYYTKNGQIKVFGYDHVDSEIEVKNLIGYVAAEDYFVKNHTLKIMADNFSILFDNWNWDLFNKYVEKWSLPLNEKFDTYSKGMKTKAMIVLAIAHSPKLLLLDEPTAGLDPLVKVEILELLRDFVEDGERAVLFSTHITPDLDKTADYVTLISEGEILETDSMDSISDKYLLVSGELNKYTNILIGVTNINDNMQALVKREDSTMMKDDSQVLLRQPIIEELMIHLITDSRK
ncbi:MAG: ABC transporter ATP-binding protein [Lachnospiraceae bacterium]|nr:ABC transporter ATP-binding protein [Lachnospiraceae bacterium]